MATFYHKNFLRSKFKIIRDKTSQERRDKVTKNVEKYLNKKGFVTREDFHALEDRVNKLSLEIKVSKAKKK